MTIIPKLLLAMLWLWSCPWPAPAQVAVIAHPAVPADSIDRGRLLDFYTGDIRSWSDGQPVVAIDLGPHSETREAFYRYLGKTSSRMRSIWLKRKLAGAGDPPFAMPTEELVVARVGTTPGAVGFVSQDRVSARVKVIAVIPTE